MHREEGQGQFTIQIWKKLIYTFYADYKTILAYILTTWISLFLSLHFHLRSFCLSMCLLILCPCKFYVPGSNDLGYILVILSACVFVCLLSTLAFAITFEPWLQSFQMTLRSMTLWSYLWPHVITALNEFCCCLWQSVSHTHTLCCVYICSQQWLLMEIDILISRG